MTQNGLRYPARCTANWLFCRRSVPATADREVTVSPPAYMIQKAGWKEWDILRGILSKYVLGGRTKGNLWSEAVSEQIFYLVIRQMQEIIEFWDKSPANGKI